MSVASSTVANPTRAKALMVRLAPYLVEAICELARAVKDKTHAQTEISGLLFGKSQDGMLTVEALKTFKDSSGPRSELARRERMEKAFAAAMTLATEDPEFAAYKLLGWFSLRGGGGLINSDVDFHNRHFKSNEDIGLVVWREGDTQITTELYAAIEAGKLGTEDYRWSSVRLSTELRHVSQPVDLVMRVRMNDDLYLRTYGAATGDERKEEWKKIADNAKRAILSFWPGKGQSEPLFPEDLTLPPSEPTAKRSFESRTLFRGPDGDPEPHSAAPAKAAPPEPAVPSKPSSPPAASTQTQPPAAASTAFVPRPSPPAPLTSTAAASTKSVEPASSITTFDINRAPRARAVPEVTGLPMVIQKQKPQPKGTPWLSMALVFVLCSGLTFAVLALKSFGSGDGKVSQIMRVLFPGSDLELHAESRGESLVVSWNRRNPVVSSSTGAVLAVTDGPKHFERRLDPDLVSEGVVSYKPVSGDVTFQLKVFGTDQSIAYGKLRVLDATSPTVSENKPIVDLSNPSTPQPSQPTEPPSVSAHPSLPPISQGPPVAPRSNESLSGYTNRSANASTNPSASNNLSSPVTPYDKKPQQPDISSAKPAQTAPQTPPASFQPSAQQASTQQQTLPPTSAPPPTSNLRTPAPRPAINNPSTSTQQTSNTAISGWDPNLPENRASQQAEAPPDSKTVDFVGPKVLLQVMPNTRNLTPGLITEVTRVEVEVRVDVNGHVQAAHLTNPNTKSQLGSAAIAAAKQWTFQPASLRGAHVASDHTIVFEFRPEGQ